MVVDSAAREGTENKTTTSFYVISRRPMYLLSKSQTIILLSSGFVVLDPTALKV